jgi:hypothetical protein
MRLPATRRSAGRGSAKNGVPRPNANRRKYKSIPANKANVGQALCQVRSGNNLPRDLRLQSAHCRLDVTLEECGVGADGFSERDTTHFGRRRHVAARRPYVQRGSALTTRRFVVLTLTRRSSHPTGHSLIRTSPNATLLGRGSGFLGVLL